MLEAFVIVGFIVILPFILGALFFFIVAIGLIFKTDKNE